MTLTNVTVFDAGHYDVVVSNAFGTVTSSAGVVQVLPPGAPSISINGQLAVGTFSVVTPATATVTVSGGFTNGFIFYTLDGTTPNLGSTYIPALASSVVSILLPLSCLAVWMTTNGVARAGSFSMFCIRNEWI